MDAMPMAGGTAMSMMWMRMPGQSWAATAASFVAAIGTSRRARLEVLTMVVAVGYFVVWSALGAAIFPLGAALAAVQMRLPTVAHAVPVATGVVLVLAGVVQCTAWKARHLAFGRVAPGEVHALSAGVGTAWRHGVCLGIHCSYCCVGFTASFLALGVMDLRVMAVVTAAITAERLAPAGVRVAHAVGVGGIVTGTLLIARALGSG